MNDEVTADHVRAAWNEGRATEREACAALAASHASRNDVARIDYMARAEDATAIAAAIRARGN